MVENLGIDTNQWFLVSIRQ